MCFVHWKGYLGVLCQEKVNTNIHVTLLCPGPVFSNVLKECFTAQPGEVIKFYFNFELLLCINMLFI